MAPHLYLSLAKTLFFDFLAMESKLGEENSIIPWVKEGLQLPNQLYFQ